MKRTRLFLSALLAFSAVPFLLSAAPVVSNVVYTQQPDGAGSSEIAVTYDLVTPDGPSTTTLLYSLNAAPFAPAATVSGDVGPGQTTGTLTLDWAVAADLPGVQSGSLMVRVVAEDGGAIPVTITSSVADGGLTNNANPTLTFTFAEPVTGFDASDVTVTNATKGAFAGSGASYTLDIIVDADGPVTASVVAEAATAASGTGNSSTASAVFGFNVDSTPPTIISRYPAPGQTIRPAFGGVSVTFSEPIIGLTSNQITLETNPSQSIFGTNPYNFGGFSQFLPLGPKSIVLSPGSATDAAGNPIPAASWNFTVKNDPR